MHVLYRRLGSTIPANHALNPDHVVWHVGIDCWRRRLCQGVRGTNSWRQTAEPVKTFHTHYVTIFQYPNCEHYMRNTVMKFPLRRFCQSKVSDSMFISLDVHRFEDHKDGIITWSGPCRETTLLFVHVFPCSGLDISVGLQNLPVRIVNRGFRKFNLAHLSN